MHLSHDIGIWIAALLTLGIYSFLYKDNPAYKLCEHLFVGVSAGYYVVLMYFSVVKPNLLDPLFTDFTHERHFLLVIPLALGILLFSRFFPKGDWLSRWSLALILGVYPALRITGFGQGDLVEQIHGTMLPLWVRGNLGTTIGNWLLVGGLLTTLIFFFFSKEHKGALGGAARIGVYFLMVSFGASYGYTVMARISLLIGRVMFLLHDWLGVLHL
ncbi:MAG: hypothetical protein E6K75_00860 [Candidatus Eisenbacteria bacterium]|uniref:Uncharacterized protein n=1 Tax=Eiseniibacteriota bacterium TaxID=2212470 RepID=A0A538TDL9_UNCEI|nr:MAG: hypothetical protein E6K75_00860 [Candidatus Eisenbacteria bacterium]